MGQFGIGQAVTRIEDQRLLTGGGRYTDDISLDGQAYAFILRSPHAHAEIKSLDTSAAKAAGGVLLVLTGEDVAAEDIDPMPCMIPITNIDGSERCDSGQSICRPAARSTFPNLECDRSPVFFAPGLPFF